MKRIVAIAAVGLLVGAGIWGYSYARSRTRAPTYRLTRVDRGPVTAAVSATGSLNAVITVQVGSQVSGQIKELLADFNTVVKKNQVIARIDPAIFQTKVNQAKADLDSSLASVVNQLAQVERAKADVDIVGADGKPTPVMVATGITDGTTTEILRSELKEGQDVIVGFAGSGTTTPPPPSGSSPRLRL